MSLDPAKVDATASLLGRLRRRLAEDGLHIALPLDGRAFDQVAGQVGGGCPSIRDLLPDAGGAVLVGDGGPSFFANFEAMRARPPAETAAAADPLDDYTREVVERAVSAAWAAGGESGPPAVRLLYPFVDATPALPFQRLGCAAGLPLPGPLGIQIHPIFGPWWAYRALVVVASPLEREPPLPLSCPGCAKPCIEACPGRAVTVAGFSPQRCMAERISLPGIACRESCAARLRCPVGLTHRYDAGQLAFHMSASLPVRRPDSRT